MLLLTVFATSLLAVNDLPGYSAFASPTPQSNSSVAARESLEAGIYRPSHPLCSLPTQWTGNYCITAETEGGGNDRKWMDTCKYRDFWWKWAIYHKYSECLPEEICESHLEQDYDDPLPAHTIICVDRPTTDISFPIAERSQVGTYTAVNTGTVVQEHMISVEVKNNLSRASVNAVLEGTYYDPPYNKNHISAADYAIVASLRGTTLKLCEYDPKRRACEPTFGWVLYDGDFVDFTFGLFPGQEARFYYGMFSLFM